MTLTFLDLYNACASQEWSMYDNDANGTSEFEKPLVIAINKAITEILYSYPFNFREKTHILFTIPGVNGYFAPSGLIRKDSMGEYCIKINSRPLKLIKDTFSLEKKSGVPEGFYIRGSKIILYPTPSEKFIITVDYFTLAVGEDKDGEEIFALKNADDIIFVPEHLEEIFNNAVISRTILDCFNTSS